ncbi:MAG TPA: hypothetical protein VLO07_08880 [Thermoanaerobaculia bacterium]|nr:hypothetical protein [Thermoanaerobaculia bacterium]
MTLKEEKLREGNEGRPVGRWTQDRRIIRDAEGLIVASARSVDHARKIVAAVNAVYGIPIDALEAWTVGVIADPTHDLVAELEAFLAVDPISGERRGADRRTGDRRRLATEVRIEAT